MSGTQTAIGRRWLVRRAWLLGCALLAGSEVAGGEGAAEPPSTCGPESVTDVSRWTDANLAAYGLTLQGVSEGKDIDKRRIDTVRSSAFSAVAFGMETFQSADQALRMIVPATRVARIRRKDDYAEIAVSRPVPLHVLAGTQPLCVEELVIPLSGEGTRKGWTFYYREASDDWFGLRLSNPPQTTMDKLKRLLAAVPAKPPRQQAVVPQVKSRGPGSPRGRPARTAGSAPTRAKGSSPGFKNWSVSRRYCAS